MDNYAQLQNRLYDSLSRSARARRGALWLRNVTTQMLGHWLAPSIDPDRNGESLLQRELAFKLRVVVDVGANRGEWTAGLLDYAPAIERVICYEPALSALGLLHDRFTSDDRVDIVEAAVADTTGEREFFEEPGGGETSSLVDSCANAFALARAVRLVTIDEELERLALAQVDFLKIDAEGMDLHVLRGAEGALRSHRIATVQFEYGGAWAKAGSTLTAAFDLLRNCGYEVNVLLPDGLYDYDPSQTGELFVYSNFVAYLPEGAANALRRSSASAL
ncbi:MAG TPA: FkbM family methyltransferase [Solirubrobacteraceae bacterium]|nr:FkbM family methyltransferase [Solirubrobacteraceae bacterium]